MASLKFKHEMSLRAKFIDETSVEVTIMDHTDKTEWMFIIPFRVPKAKTVKMETTTINTETEISNVSDEDIKE